MQVVPSWHLRHMRFLLENPRLRILTRAHDTIRKNWVTENMILTKIYPSTCYILCEKRPGIRAKQLCLNSTTFVTFLQITTHLKIRDNISISICRAFGIIKWDSVCGSVIDSKTLLRPTFSFRLPLGINSFNPVSLRKPKAGWPEHKYTVTRFGKKKSAKQQVVIYDFWQQLDGPFHPIKWNVWQSVEVAWSIARALFSLGRV